MLYRLLGIAVIVLAIFAIVGNISNAKQFGQKILTNKLVVYFIVLIAGITLLIY